MSYSLPRTMAKKPLVFKKGIGCLKTSRETVLSKITKIYILFKLTPYLPGVESFYIFIQAQ